MRQKQVGKTSLHMIKVLVITMIMCICLLGNTITVFADDPVTYSEPQQVFTDWGPNGTKWATSTMHPKLTPYFRTAKEGRYTYQVTGGDGKTYFYKNSDTNNITRVGNELALDDVAQEENKDERKDAVSSLTDVTDGMGLQADVGTAAGILSGFTGVITTLLGLLTVLISIGMTVFSAFDLAYIAFPVFRNKCEDAKQTGTGPMASGKKTASGESKLRFVSDDAQYAVEAATTENNGQNPFVIYFKKRIISYLVLAVLLFILLTGKITILTEIAIKLVDGILSIIQGV